MPNARGNVAALTPRSRPPANSRDRAAWPFVDRVDVLGDLARGLAAGRGAYVVGPWGVGKSRLVEEAVGAVAAGRRVVRLRASAASAAVPLSVFFPLVSRPPDTDGPDLRAVFNVVVDQLAERPDERPLLVVDDAHLLDGLSAALTLHLATHGIATVAVTARAGAPVPDALAALWADGLVDRVDLGPLHRAAVAELAERALGGPVDAETVELLWAETAGNPLLVRELILAALHEGRLRDDTGAWHATTPVVPGVALCELVERRVADLDPALRTAVELVAVAGSRPLDAVGAPVVEALHRAGLVAVVANGRRTAVRMAEPFLGAALRALLGPVGQRGAATELSASVENVAPRRRDDLLRAATWQLRAGRSVDGDTAVAAAHRAIELRDHARAATLARAALGAGAGVAAALVAAEADLACDRPGDAANVLAALAPDELSGSEAARYVALRGIALGLGLGRIDDGLRFAGGADDVAYDAAGALAALLYLAAGRASAAYAAADPVLNAHDADPVARRLAVTAAVYALVECGQPAAAVALGEVTLAAAARAGTTEDWPDAAWLRAAVIEAHAWHGDPVAVAASLDGSGDGTGDGTVAGAVALAAGRALLVAGRAADALAWLQRATAAFDASDPTGLAPLAAAATARAHALGGDLPAAETARARAAAVARGQVAWHATEAGLADVWLGVAGGDAEGARARALDLAERHRDEPRARAAFLYDAMRLGAPDATVAAALAETTRGTTSPLLAAMTVHATAYASRDPNALLDVAQRLEDLGALAAAADAAAHAAGLRGATGRVVTAATRRAHALAERTGAAPTPALAALGPARRLSDRERDVVRRAAAGRTNRAIADELSVSIRTVEAHLYSAYAKLGIAGRADLGSVIDATTD